MSAPVKPQVDTYDASTPSGSNDSGSSRVTSQTVDSGIERPYAKDANSNLPAKDDASSTTVERVSSQSNGGNDLSGKIERPYAEDNKSSSSDYAQTAKNAAGNIKDAAMDKAGAVSEQASDNLKAGDNKHHYA